MVVPPFAKAKDMARHRDFFSKAKHFLIEVAALVSLALVLVKVIVTEFQHLFR